MRITAELNDRVQQGIQASAELRVVAAACAVYSDASLQDRLESLLRAGVDWERVLRIARRHRVDALAFRALAPHVGDPLRQQWQGEAKRRAFTAMSLSAESARIARLLQAQGVEAVFLKGAPLAVLAYGDITVRHAKDIDILVPPGRLLAAEALLRDAGYTRILPPESSSDADLADWRSRSKDTHWLQRNGSIEIELHWGLADSGPDETLVSSDLQAVPFSGGAQLLTLRSDLLLRYLCIHGASHAWSRLKWLADVHAMLLRAGPDAAEELYAGSRPGREARSVAQALLLCELFFDLPIAPTLRQALLATNRVKRLVQLATSVITSGGAERELFETAFASSRVYLSRLLLASNRGEFWREARLSLLPAEDALEARTAGRTPAAAQAIRIWKWAGKHLGRGLRRT